MKENVKKLENLIKISKIDLKIFEIKKILSKVPQKLNEIRQKIDKGRSKLEALITENETMASRDKILQEEITEIDSKIEKSKAKLYEIKTNEAYKMALKEIDNWTHEKSLREEGILNNSEIIERNQPEIEKLQNQFKPEEEKLLNQEKEINKECEKFNTELLSLDEQRIKYISDIDKKFYSQYERIRKAKNGIALVEVNSANCSACNLKIRPQSFNLLIRGELQKCSNCGRMMYYKPEDN